MARNDPAPIRAKPACLSGTACNNTPGPAAGTWTRSDCRAPCLLTTIFHVRRPVRSQSARFRLRKGNLCRQNAIGSIFESISALSRFGRAMIENSRVTAGGRYPSSLARRGGVHSCVPTTQAVGTHEIIDRGLRARLRVWTRTSNSASVGLGHDLLDLAVGAHRDGRFGDDQA